MDRICLITPQHISFQPRVIREADSLYEAGYEVRVISRQIDSDLIKSDCRLMQTRKWHLEPINLGWNEHDRVLLLTESILQKVNRQLFNVGVRTESVTIKGYMKGLSQLMTIAVRHKADWFIAHTQAALPIAVKAAKRWNARVGFDCEDLLTERGTDPTEIVRQIESKYLPQCDYVSVPSYQIGERFSKEYGIRSPRIVYNVFPQALAVGLVPPKERPKRSTIRIHWFSQTLGPGRGIEEAIRAMANLSDRKVEFHIRGRLPKKYELILMDLIHHYDLVRKVIFYPLIDHDELVGTMGQFDIGLALERPENLSTSQTISNKIFTYLLGGLAVGATDTQGQREILEKIPSAGFLYPAGNPQALTDGLRRWIDNRESLVKAQQAAWDAARERFCWDKEKEKFLSIFQSLT